MFNRLGIRNRLELLVFVSLALTVAISPLGGEASHPIVLGIYRTLLLVIIAAYAFGSKPAGAADICPYFLIGIAAILTAMLASILLHPASHFESIYVFYKNALFLGAFIALAHLNRDRPVAWKYSILAGVVLVDLTYLVAAFVSGERPLLGPFVNPNYFASFLVAGLAVCTATVLFGTELRTRICAGVAGSILYYGIGQTSSRGATLAALAVLGLAVFRAIRQRGNFRWASMVLIGILVASVSVAANTALINKFLDRNHQDPYNYQRVQIWLGTLKMIGSSPLTGVGLGRYYYASKVFTPAVEGTIARYRKWPNIAHSEYLQYIAEIGVPAALLMFLIGGYLFRTAWLRAETIPKECRIFNEAALLAAMGLGFHALVDNNWTVPVMAAGLAVISQADLLPYRKWPVRPSWTPAWTAALGVFFFGVLINSTLAPALGLFFNESGHRAYAAADFKRAETMHRMALGILPDHPVLLDNLGMVYFDEFLKTHEPGHLDRAESLFRRSMAANPSFDVPGGHLETVLIQRLTGNLKKDLPIHAEIVEADRQVLAANPFNPFIRKNLAEALYNMGEHRSATEELIKTVELEPNYVAAHLRLAQWYEQDGDHGDSEKYRKKAIDVVTQYQGQPLPDSFDRLLLGRPEANAGQP